MITRFRRRHQRQKIVHDLVLTKMVGHLTGFTAHQPELDRCRWTEPLIVGVIIDAIEQVKQQRGSNVRARQLTYAVPGKIAYPHPNGVSSIVANTPGIASAV